MHTLHDGLNWRSLLFIPASNRSFVEKAASRGADGIILDLEDSIPPEQKHDVRFVVAEHMLMLAQQQLPVVVRINNDLRNAVRDLEAVVSPNLTAIMVPKTESAGYLRQLDTLIRQLEAERGLAPGHIRMLGLIETAGGIVNLPDIARATPRLCALALGSEDLIAELGCVPTTERLLGYSETLLVNAKANHLQAIGIPGALANFNNLELLKEQVQIAREMGFTGALAIHPRQISLFNEGFAATEDEVSWAKTVVERFAAAQAEGIGVIAIDGQMIDAPVLQRAKDILTYS
ncbi:HpcH/HpaI aldolase/citrate lyase family protein [Endozoicomonas lisbonensis]|uniref:Citrate lyase subunit beta/citryl-CoA lyase n=1 Tax=Endozoicomonas lisbonensis TaxID=3120522 RepID=A0ABV2SI31_9GAMM